MRKIRVGIIGTGFSASAHMEALRRIPNIDVVAVASRKLSSAQNFASYHRIPNAYADAHALIGDDSIDVVHNCTTNHLHFQYNKEILLAGKHLMTEKPLALNSEQTAELVELAEKSSSVSAITFNYRFYPLVSHMKEQIAAKKHGKAHMVYGGYVQDWCLNQSDYSWRMDKKMNGESRAIADIGSHWCDTVEYILGKKIVSVCADLGRVHEVRYKSVTQTGNTFTQRGGQGEMEEVPIDTEDFGNVLVRFEDNIQGVFTVSQVNAGRKNKFHFDIATTHASLSWDQENPNELWIGRKDKANEVLMKDPSLLSEQSAKLALYPGGHQEGWPDGLKNLFINFYDTILSGQKQGNFAAISDGHHIMHVIEAIVESHHSRQWVDVKEGKL